MESVSSCGGRGRLDEGHHHVRKIGVLALPEEEKMRSALSTIQQTLTPEAATVLNQSIAEASRRSHSQTTPLHAAATLLASPSGYLRQACIRSHPSTSHPLQCRALELCFSVALDRLPSSTITSGPILEPPISNALMAALKRAQAHQRRGCPEQQQQPLLAVKVELEQLIVSILDDPSVSRVMREASFSSPAVKATIEQSITSTSSSSSLVWSPPSMSSPSAGGLGLRSSTATSITLLPAANWNAYINPRLHQSQQKHQHRVDEDVKKVLDVLVRSRKRNPVLVGDSEPEALMKEALQKIDNRAMTDGLLKNVHVVNLDKDFSSDKSQIPNNISKLTNLIETKLTVTGKDENTGVIVNLGDLKWLVDNRDEIVAGGQIQQQQQLVSEVGKGVVAEIGKMIARFNKEGGHGRLWLIGTASCATYLRCQVYHPSMESDWDLQAIPIAPRQQSVASMLPRNGGNGILSNCVESLAPHRGFMASRTNSLATHLPIWSSGSTGHCRRNMCSACTENYEKELAKLVAEEFEKASSNFKPEVDQSLPLCKDAMITSGNRRTTQDCLRTREAELKWKESTEGLMKRWYELCLHLHPTFHQSIVSSEMPPVAVSPSICNLYDSDTLPQKAVKPRLSPDESICTPQFTNLSGPILTKQASSPGSPVRTELTLGRDQNHRDHIKYLNGCMQDLFPKQQPDNIDNKLDADSFKRLYKGLTEKISWQPEAASSVAITVTQCQSGKGRMILRKKADTWLLFLGPDGVGKKKMASALSEILFGIGPMMISLKGSDGQLDRGDGRSNMGFRRKMALDQIAEAVRRNPFSVFVIEHISEADVIMQERMKQAIDSGRLLDSHGREVSLGSAIFILIADSLPDKLTNPSMDSLIQCENKMESIANYSWQLELLIGERSGKRRGEGLSKDVVRPTKARTAEHSLSLDLNLGNSATEEDIRKGSPNSSDLTVEHNHLEKLMTKPSTFSFPTEMINAVDSAIVFKPVDFGPLCSKVSEAVISKFNYVMGSEHQLKIGTEVLELIVAGIWFRGLEVAGFEDWMNKVLMPSFRRLRNNQIIDKSSIVRLVPIKGGESMPGSDWLPSRITIAGS